MNNEENEEHEEHEEDFSELQYMRDEEYEQDCLDRIKDMKEAVK